MRKIIIFVMMLMLIPIAFGSFPKIIDIQGAIRNSSNGSFVPDGNKVLNVTYYLTSDDSQLYSDEDTKTVTNGIFNFVLGHVTLIPYNIFNNTPTYIRFKVDGDQSGRVNITAVPYSFYSLKSNDSMLLDGYQPIDFLLYENNATLTSFAGDMRNNSEQISSVINTTGYPCFMMDGNLTNLCNKTASDFGGATATGGFTNGSDITVRHLNLTGNLTDGVLTYGDGYISNDNWTYTHKYTLPELAYPIAGNRFRLNGYVQKYATNDLPVATADVSGGTYNPLTGTLFAVSNGVPVMYEFAINGTWLRTITLTNFLDTEGIGWMYGNTYVISQERVASPVLHIFTIENDTVALDANNFKTITPDFTISDNKGMEGASFDYDNNWFYVSVEKQSDGTNGGRVFKVLWNGTSTFYSALNTSLLAKGYNDLADIYYDRESKHVFLLAQEQNTIIEAGLDGVIYNELALDPNIFSQPEGLSFSLDGNNMFVFGEADDYAHYILNPAEGLNVHFDNLSVVKNISANWFNGWINFSWIAGMVDGLNTFIIDNNLQQGNSSEEITTVINATGYPCYMMDGNSTNLCNVTAIGEGAGDGFNPQANSTEDISRAVNATHVLVTNASYSKDSGLLAGQSAATYLDDTYNAQANSTIDMIKAINMSSLNASHFISINCSAIMGGSDDDYCADASAAGGFSNATDITVRAFNVTTMKVSGGSVFSGNISSLNVTNNFYVNRLFTNQNFNSTVKTNISNIWNTKDLVIQLLARWVYANSTSSSVLVTMNNTLRTFITARDLNLTTNLTIAYQDYGANNFLTRSTDNTTLSTAIRSSWNSSSQIRTSLVNNDGKFIANNTAATLLNTTITRNFTINDGGVGLNFHIDIINTTHVKSWIG